MMHNLLHEILKNEKDSEDKNILDTLLILSQALILFEKTLDNFYSLKPLDQIPDNLIYSEISKTESILFVSKSSNISTSRVTPVHHHSNYLWICLYKNLCKVYKFMRCKPLDSTVNIKLVTILNIIQDKLQNLGLNQIYKKSQRFKISKGKKLYFSGKFDNAIKYWKEIIENNTLDLSKKQLTIIFHSILYTCLIKGDNSIDLINYIQWLPSIFKIITKYEIEELSSISKLELLDLWIQEKRTLKAIMSKMMSLGRLMARSLLSPNKSLLIPSGAKPHLYPHIWETYGFKGMFYWFLDTHS